MGEEEKNPVGKFVRDVRASNEKDFEEWLGGKSSSGGTKPEDDSEKNKKRAAMTAQEVENIKTTAERFWREHGLNEDVSAWSSYPDGKTLINHFEGKGKGNDDLFTGCQDYFSCKSKYTQATSEKDYSFDANQVDYARVKTVNDIGFFLVIMDLPRFLISDANWNTKNWVKSMIDASKSYKEIFEEAAKKAGEKKENKLAAEWAEKEDELKRKNRTRQRFGLEQIDIEQKKKEWEEKKSLGRFGFVLKFYKNYADKHTEEILDEKAPEQQRQVKNEGEKEATEAVVDAALGEE